MQICEECFYHISGKFCIFSSLVSRMLQILAKKEYQFFCLILFFERNHYQIRVRIRLFGVAKWSFETIASQISTCIAFLAMLWHIRTSWWSSKHCYTNISNKIGPWTRYSILMGFISQFSHLQLPERGVKISKFRIFNISLDRVTYMYLKFWWKWTFFSILM